jgi:hypothetical protein
MDATKFPQNEPAIRKDLLMVRNPFRSGRLVAVLSVAVVAVVCLAGSATTASAATVHSSVVSAAASTTTPASASGSTSTGVAIIQVHGQVVTLQPVAGVHTLGAAPALIPAATHSESGCSGSVLSTYRACAAFVFGGKRLNEVLSVQGTYELHHCAQFSGYWMLFGRIAGTNYDWYVKRGGHFGNLADCVAWWAYRTPTYGINRFMTPGAPASSMMVKVVGTKQYVMAEYSRGAP